MAIVTVEAMDDERLAEVAGLTELEAARCYRVAFDLVVIEQVFERYVLGTVTSRKDDIPTPHCWVKEAAGHFDPLLQALGERASAVYEAWLELSRDEVIGILVKEYGEAMLPEILNGAGMFCPPAMDMKGEIRFCDKL